MMLANILRVIHVMNNFRYKFESFAINLSVMWV